MRLCLILSCFLLLGAPGHGRAEPSTDTRPALLGTGPKSLINILDPQRLMQRGQTDAAVNFQFLVGDQGSCYSVDTYGGTPDSKALSEELIDHLGEARCLPALYRGKAVGARLSGTLIYTTTGGQGHLRIFLNQDDEHLKQRDDFIAPQPIFPPDSKFHGFSDRLITVLAGVVVVRISTDVTGKLVGAKYVREYPVGSKMGPAIMKDIGKVTFTPGFLHGRPIACTSYYTVPFSGGFWGSRHRF